MKKLARASLASVGVLALGLTAGCTTADPGEEGATKLTLWTFVELHSEFYQAAADRWNEEFPDRKIDLVTEAYPIDQMHNNLQLALQSGSGAPDLVDIQIDRTSNYMGDNLQFVDLAEKVKPYEDDIVTELLSPYEQDGGVYALPLHIGANVMYYNTAVLAEAGVDPADIVTWDDFHAAGEQVLAATGKPMTTFETTDHLYYWSMINQQGSDYYDENLELALDSTVNVETLDFIASMIADGTAITTPGGNHHAEEYYAFMSGSGAASVQMPLWYMGRFLENMPNLQGDIAIYPAPAWEEGGSRTAARGGTGTAVTNQTKDVELATDFLVYSKLTKEANFQVWEVLGFDPIRFDVWEDERIREPNKFYDFFGDGIFDLLLDVRDEFNPVYMGPGTPEVTAYLSTTVLNSVLREGSASAEEALSSAQAELLKSIQR